MTSEVNPEAAQRRNVTSRTASNFCSFALFIFILMRQNILLAEI